MKALKTKVILSGIVLVFAFIATIGTTFAWFTVSQTATVDTMTLNVTSADSLLILPVDATNLAAPETGYVADGSGSTADLLTASNYKTFLEVSDLYSAGYQIGSSATTPWRVSPATVVATDYSGYDLKTINYMDEFDTRSLAAATSNSADGQYLELKFWVLLQGDEGTSVPLELIDSSSISSNANNSTNQAEVEDALRMVVWADDSEFATSGGAEGSAFIFGNDMDYNYTFTGDFAATNTNLNTLGGMEATAGDLDDLTTLVLGTDHFDLDTYTGAVNPKDIFTIQANTPTLLTVLIFVEGWDAQATNNISLAEFDISFGFQIGTLDA